ncbi:MAG: 6-hydroxymethylpterin diphosphokinase MptE-like protein [Bacillota bacterium]
MIWEQNLRAIRRRDPALAELLENSPAAAGLAVITAKNGDPVPVWRDQPLASRYDPRREAYAWAAGIVNDLSATGRVYLVFGLGLGYHLEALLQKDPGAHFMVFETEPGWWRRLLELRDVRHLIRHKRVFIQPTLDFSVDSPAFIQITQGTFAGEVKVAEIPAYRDLFEQAHQQWRQGLLDSLRHIRVGLATREHWKDVWLENSIANLFAIFANPGVSDLQNGLTATPAVMAAAGPSLNEHLNVLRGLAGRVPIIAAGTGLIPLAQAGIHPDYVVSIDPGEANYAALKDCLDLPDTTLVFFSSLHPRVAAEFRGPKVSAFADQEYLPQWLGELAGFNHKGVLPDAASVAIPTFKFILDLGCPEIILLGQDLSFPDPEHYYAGRRKTTVTDYLPRTNIAGETAYTTKQLLSMLRELEMYIAEAGRRNVRVYNASRTGLPIAGTTPVDFAAWAREQADRRFTRPESSLGQPSPQEILEKLREPLATVRRELAALRETATAAVLALAPLHDQYRDTHAGHPLGVPTRGTHVSGSGRVGSAGMPALAGQLSTAVPRLNQILNHTAYQKIIRRTVSNLDLLVRTRKLDLDAADAAQVRDFIAMLYNFATAVGGRAERYHAELGKMGTGPSPCSVCN